MLTINTLKKLLLQDRRESKTNSPFICSLIFSKSFQNHSSQSKSRTTLEHPSLENPLNNPYDLRTPHSKEFRVKTTDNPSGKLLREFIMSPVQKLRSETSGGPPSGRGTLGHMFTSPRNTLDKPPLHKSSLPGASYKSAILDRLPSNHEKSSKV